MSLHQTAIELLEACKQIRSVFGAPGDFGYETREGIALYQLYTAANKLNIALDQKGAEHSATQAVQDTYDNAQLSAREAAYK